MLISDSHKFIFIHNHKVAGSSIARSLSKYGNVDYRMKRWHDILKRLSLVPYHYPSPYPWHITAKELKEKMGDNPRFDSYFKFGFVRDPWDLQVSLYTFMLKLEKHNQHRLIKNMRNFDEYIDWRVNKDLRLQKTFFYDNDTLLVDFVGKFENLSKDYSQICYKLNVTGQLPHINKSRKDTDLALYTQSSVDAVYDAFFPDVIAFGYKKPKLHELSTLS